MVLSVSLAYVFFLAASEISKKTSKGWFIVEIISSITLIYGIYTYDLLTIAISGLVIYYLWDTRTEFGIKIKELNKKIKDI